MESSLVDGRKQVGTVLDLLIRAQFCLSLIHLSPPK